MSMEKLAARGRVEQAKRAGVGSVHLRQGLFRRERNLVVTHNPQAKLRLEMEMERMRQTHSKEMESRDEEVEEARQSCQKKVWHLSC